ncbi:MAG: protein-L-isoaspartate(D-aspartate) O-methyltransferase [Candidatus Helarchaeota archaeon]|nr:protein-L-isoaspartate(D-aspartate) O-methyltransferase [Candidatus Helarchaeota archaeon]
MELEAQKEELIRKYKKWGPLKVLRSEAVENAFRALKRELFMPRGLERRAYTNRAYFLAEGSTISAPYMHVILAEALNLQEGQKILEIGAGSGYQAALCALIVAPKDEIGSGHVFTIETLPKIAEFARENIKKAGLQDRVTVICGDGSMGLPEEAPLDRILVTAYAKKVPPSLIQQLAVGGQLVMPVGRFRRFQSLVRYTKVNETKIKKKTLRRYSVYFVRLVGEEGWTQK